MTNGKIRIGVIGANSRGVWASRSHLPAIAASPDFDLRGVCTTRLESAQESAARFGAGVAFDDYREMLKDPDLDAVAVVVRVPSHFGPTKDAINAGKAVFTEWPLGRSTAEAVVLADLAKARGVRTAVGLQARVSPSFMYLRDKIRAGYVGPVVSCHLTLFRDGVDRRTSDRSWLGDVTNGATTLTIAAAHALDSLLFAVDDICSLSATVSTQVKRWYETDTHRIVDVTSPDTVIVQGRLDQGGLISAHIGAVPWGGSRYRLEIHGLDGTLVASGTDSPQLTDIRLEGSRGSDPLKAIDVPTGYVYVSESTPVGTPRSVGQLYHQFAKTIRTGDGDHPDFDVAVKLHRLVDAIQLSSETGREVEVGSR